MKRINWLLLLILAFATFLRFWHLGNYPALNADEAAIGYNVYSLIKTGMDEHSHPWPVHFQSFNDYKPGLYFYLVLPFVKFLGLNSWSVRIPNATLSVLTVYLVYLLVYKISENFKEKIKNPRTFALIAAFFIAISPWHIQFSRGGWEVNTATFFMVLGVYLYLKSLENIRFLVFSFVAFCLSLYTYHAARVVIPLLIIGILVIFRKEVVQHLKAYLICALCAFILLLPLGKDMLRPEISSRAAGVGLFADPGPISRINEQRGEHEDYNSLGAKLLHNKFVNYTLAFAENWSAHYHGLFLFLSGDAVQRDKVPETGEMYMFDVIWLVIGLWWMIRNIRKETKVILLWLVVAPVAAALTFQSPHALRAENMVIPLVIVTAFGFTQVLLWLESQKKTFRVFGELALILLVSWQFFRYVHMYWVHMSKEYPFSSQYGVSQLVEYVSKNQDKYKNVVVTERYDQPYILFLFYMKYPPNEFQKEHKLTNRDDYGFSTVSSFGKYVFKNIDWEVDKLKYPDSLIIGTREEIPKEANIIQKIYGTNGYEYFDVVAN
jgi:4-amino-4-deoxy-L-arabinose transferase-like glycosyltransferase